MKIEIGKIIRLSFCKKITQKDNYTLCCHFDFKKRMGIKLTTALTSFTNGH